MKRILFTIILILFTGNVYAAQPFIASKAIMTQMKNDENQDLVNYTNQYLIDVSKRQAVFIKNYGSSMMNINKNLKRVQDDIYNQYNIKDSDGDNANESIIDAEEFNKSTRAVDLNKFLNQKREKKKELIIAYFRNEIEKYKIFISGVSKLKIPIKTKELFQNELSNLTKSLINDVPKNINETLANEKVIMAGQNPITLLKLQNPIDISYVSMLDNINNVIDNNLSEALIKSLAATPKIHRDIIKNK